MKRKFLADYDLIELKSRLNSIIEINSEDNLRTHFRQIVLLKDEGKVSGIIKNNNFKIWTHEQGRTGATGIFYPIIEGCARPLSKGLEIEFKSKMNMIGRIVFLIIAILIAYVTLTGIVIQENNEFKYLIRRIFVGGVFFCGMLFIPSLILFRTAKIVKQHLIKGLELSLIVRCPHQTKT